MTTFNEIPLRKIVLNSGVGVNFAMDFVIFVPGTTSATTYNLSDLQTEIVIKSIFKENEQHDVVMYSDNELLHSRDMDVPLNDLLSSINKAGEMLARQSVSTGILTVHGVNAEDMVIGLTDLQTGVVVARLGINLEMNYFVSDAFLDMIYGSDWEPEFESEKEIDIKVQNKSLPYTKKSIMKDVPTPRKIKSLLDKAIIGQDRVKEKLATAVYQQEMAVRYNALYKGSKNFVPMRRRNILLYGPSGSGKTAMLQKMAEILDRPVVIFDSTKLTPAGYSGGSTESVLRELLVKAKGDTERAAHGIVYLDEWDKAFIGANGNKEVSSFKVAAVSFELLRMLDGCDVTFEHNYGSVTLNTANILFILGGAFPNLDRIVLNRISGRKNESASGIGFMRENVKMEKTESYNVPDATPDDLKEYGIPAELLGRIATVCRCMPLGREELVNILLHSEQSPLREYITMFHIHNVSLKLADKTIEAIAEQALEKNLGARGLVSVLEKVLLPVLYKVAGNRKRLTVLLKPECFTEDAQPTVIKKQTRAYNTA